ncbi:hypothetical protein BFS06_14360 [Clostridium perfringens]|uniref:Uncharacterized protein n=1 Tax=Clostridium perfringens TaxID=1502 RepID=A0A140GRD9_CLOPF|nr:hypothetical protein [Clostridium perfringens]AMN31098.1 hypothetical protein JFP838_pA0182 [Clostridium perfringens]TBX14389.1 hypothetical protein BFS06_14360 [Clostridium perfringens]
MITILNKIEDNISKKLLLEGKEDFDFKELYLIDYNMYSVNTLNKRVDIINYLYLNLKELDLNEDLFALFTEIVEIINNLSTLTVNDSIDMNYAIKNMVERLNNFQFRKIESFELNSNIKTLKPTILKQDEFDEKLKYIKESVHNYSDNLEFYILEEEDNLSIIIPKDENNLTSFIKDNSHKTIVNELINVLIKIGSLNNSVDESISHYLFEFSEEKLYKSVSFYLNEQIQALIYLLNSYSFRNNVLEMFDLLEIENRIRGFNKRIDNIANEASSIYNYIIENNKI